MASQVAPIVIQGGRLIDGNGGKPVENATLVIEGTASNKWPREKSIFPASRRSLMPGGRTVLPGFIDNHIHYRGFMGEILLAHGVTSGRDFGIGTRQGSSYHFEKHGLDVTLIYISFHERSDK